MNRIFLISHIKPNNQEPEFYIYDGMTTKKVDNIDSYITDRNYIITFDIYNLANFQRTNGRAALKNVVDVECIKRQIIGKSKKDLNEVPWILWKMMEAFYKDGKRKQLKKIQQIYFNILEKDKSTEDCFHNFNKNMKIMYDELLTELDKKNEYQRFFQVEQKITDILLQTNHNGIMLDGEKIIEKIKFLNRELYKIRNQLQLVYKIFSSNDKKHITSALKSIGFNMIAHVFDADDITSYKRLLKLHQDKHELIKWLYQEKRYSKNRTVLLKIGNQEESYIYPNFESFGTVTSRILLTAPSLQQLNREHRDIIITPSNKTLVYIDYCQFEAGILANESGDQRLIDCYEKDIYTALSQEIFDDDKHRDICKQIFFKYSYGAKAEHMELLLQDFKSELLNKQQLKNKIELFFQKFPDLNAYRTNLEAQLAKERKIGTHCGNFRYLNESDDVRKNWTMSQRIQGIASYILKKAIIKTYKEEPDVEFLIPMHDAALYQVPIDKKDAKEASIKKIYESVFSEMCPKIKQPACKIKSFAE